MTPDLPSIRSRHATAMANRKLGTFDSRDDDIRMLMAEVDRLQADVGRWRYVREHGPWCLTKNRKADESHLIYHDEADAAVDAAMKSRLTRKESRGQEADSSRTA